MKNKITINIWLYLLESHHDQTHNKKFLHKKIIVFVNDDFQEWMYLPEPVLLRIINEGKNGHVSIIASSSFGSILWWWCRLDANYKLYVCPTILIKEDLYPRRTRKNQINDTLVPVVWTPRLSWQACCTRMDLLKADNAPNISK